jgi:ketosteroid isomerase-like protein
MRIARASRPGGAECRLQPAEIGIIVSQNVKRRNGMRPVTVTLLSLMVFATGARAEDPQSSMQAANDQFTAAFNSGDSARLGQLYSEDAVLMPPSSKTIMGKTAVEEYYRTALRSVADSKFTPTDTKTLGDSDVLESGTFTAKTRGAHPRPITGKFAILWHKAGTDWKIGLDIWNTD